MLANESTQGDALRDSALASGERMASHIVSAALEAHGLSALVVDGAAVPSTDDRDGGGRPDLPPPTDAVCPPLPPHPHQRDSHAEAVLFRPGAGEANTTTGRA